MTTNLAAARERDVTAPNRRAVLSTLLKGERLSRIDIARHTGLAPASVNRLAAGMIDAGLIVEAGSDESTGGRPSMLLAFNPDAAQVLAFDVTPQAIEVATLNLQGQITSRSSHPTGGAQGQELADHLVQLAIDIAMGGPSDSATGTSAQATTEQAIEPAPESAEAPQAQAPRFAAIGVSVPGPVDDEGVVTVAPSLGWQNLDLKAMLEQALGQPVAVENDMNLYALAEWTESDSGQEGSLAVLGVYHGIGLGIVEAGRIWRGRGGAGGQMGRMYMDPAGFASKGHAQFGQMETLLGASALRDRAIQEGLIPETSKTADPLFQLAAEAKPADLSTQPAPKAGVRGRAPETVVEQCAPETQAAPEAQAAPQGAEAQAALAFVEGALEGYAFQIANVSAILAPDTLVMAGLFQTWWELVIPILDQKLAGTVLHGPELVPSKLQGGAKLVGAALYALEESGGILALA